MSDRTDLLVVNARISHNDDVFAVANPECIGGGQRYARHKNVHRTPKARTIA